jgi:hypothetical protein
MMLAVFAHAWDSNAFRSDRWKLLYKLRERDLLYRDEVLARILASQSPRDWETLLGSLAHETDRQPALERMRLLAPLPLKEMMGRGMEWDQSQGLLNLILSDSSYVSGEVWER